MALRLGRNQRISAPPNPCSDRAQNRVVSQLQTSQANIVPAWVLVLLAAFVVVVSPLSGGVVGGVVVESVVPPPSVSALPPTVVNPAYATPAEAGPLILRFE